MSMDTQAFSVDIVAMVVVLAMVLAMMTMTKQAFAFEDSRHCNEDEALLLIRGI
jgi:hypothetical protein